MAQELEAQTQQELAQMQRFYDTNKDKVIDLLLATVTGVTIEVADNLKIEQA
jgi:hypothetical protein